MNKSKRFLTIVLMVFTFLMVVMGGVFAQGDGNVRFAHVVPGAPSVDVYLNGQLAVSDLAFGEASGYIAVPAGSYSLSANSVGTSNAVFTQDISITGGSSVTMIASSATAPSFAPFSDELTAVEFGKTRFSIVHAIEGAPAIDVVFTADGTVIAEGLEYGNIFGTFDVPADVYNLAVVPTGSDVSSAIAELSLPLSGGTSNIAVIYGTAVATEAVVATAPTAASADSGMVRFVHTVVGASDVDVVINGTLVIPALSLDNPSEHIALPAGSHEVALRVSGTDSDIISTTVDITAGQAMTLVALGTPAGLTVSSFTDDLSGISSDSAVVSVINAIPESEDLGLSLADGTSLASGLSFDSAGDAISIPAGDQSFTLNVTIGDDAGTINIPASTFYGGSYYNLIALAGNTFTGPQLLIAETDVARGLGGASEVIAVTPAETTGDSEVVVSTPAPVVSSGTDVPAITARVALEPGANLQLRQYPSSEALSLGLAPSGTILTINGRRGPSVYGEGEIPDEPVDMTDFDADPAEGLDEEEDLSAEDTWLNVTFATPDGGQIIAWVNALYVEIRNAEGELQRLADLPLIPQNTAGEAIATAITPPPVPVDTTSIVVFNLDAGVTLNIRRTRGTDGEVLARVANGTVFGFIGVAEDEEWAFIEYLPPEGGTITGWVSTGFIQYQLNGEVVDLATLEVEEMLAFVDDETRGEIRGDLSRPPLPTPDPLEDVVVGEVALDVNASLHLRRDPDSQAESLDLIPPSTRVLLEARTLDNVWVKVTYEGTTGWVASQYLTLSFNGEFVELEEVIDEVPVEVAGEAETEAEDTAAG